MTADLQALLRDLDTALEDWMVTYAWDMSGANEKKAARRRFDEGGGTLAYIAALRERIRKAGRDGES